MNQDANKTEQHTDTAESENTEASVALQEKIQELEIALAAANDAVLREKAENENLRKRSGKELEEAHQYAITSFARELVEVLENLYRALDNVPNELYEANEQVKNFIDGVTMTQKILLTAFAKNAISRVYPVHEVFDHNYHQAISQIEDNEKAPNTVMQVIRAGYKIKDRLLQPALVIVSKNSQ